MQDKAKDALRRKIEGFFKNLRVEQDLVGFSEASEHVESLAKEIASHRGRWIPATEAVGLIITKVYESLLSVPIDDRADWSGTLWDCFGDAGATDLRDTLVAFIESVPRRYTIYLALPKTRLEISPQQISNGFAIVCDEALKEADDAVGLLGRFANKEEETGKQYFLKVTLEGYCRSGLDNPVIRRAISNFKIAVQRLYACRILQYGGLAQQGIAALLDSVDHRVPKIKVKWKDETGGAGDLQAVDLPFDMSRFIGALTFDEKSPPLDKAIESDAIDELLRDNLTLGALLMHGDPDGAAAVRAAIEWCFDSYVSENETIKFLQLAIGLEALLGEDSERDGLTKMLADRAAYLVSPSVAQRKRTRSRFVEFYDARSKIVHGRASTLKEDQRHQMLWGTSLLERAINAELRNLRMQAIPLGA